MLTNLQGACDDDASSAGPSRIGATRRCDGGTIQDMPMRLATFPRFPLIVAPTPLQRARNLERRLGDGAPRIYLKRDDLTGLAFGGNKARKLEYLVADALARGVTVLVTEGTAQSNHARQTAAAAAVAGLKCVLVLDRRFGDELQGNLLLDRLMGAEVRFVPRGEDRPAGMARAAEELRARGEVPYVMPAGGSVPIGALAYVNAVQELLIQLTDLGEAPGRLYFATSSLGTHAGLAVGARAFSAPFAVVGIAAEDTTAELAPRVASLATETAELVGLDARFTPDDVTIDDRFVGPGYGHPTPEGLQAGRLLAVTEAVFLDPVYTGKAMAGLLSHMKEGRVGADEAVVFLHTGGGPSLFAHGPALLG
jgi:D-cysteine desulfhydrase family pyridoxal phosphate-dependent enzyme